MRKEVLARLQSMSCEYCSSSLAEELWESQWIENHTLHYKVAQCDDCHKETRVQVDFFGSGDDKVEEEASLDSIMRTVNEGEKKDIGL